MKGGIQMREFLNDVMESTRKYSVLDFSLLKINLIAIGILLGLYFSEFLGRYINMIWIVAGISYVWVMYITFIAYREK